MVDMIVMVVIIYITHFSSPLMSMILEKKTKNARKNDSKRNYHQLNVNVYLYTNVQ